MIGSKECIYCKKVKPFNEFAKHPTRYDGLDGRCKECIKKRVKEVKELRKVAPKMSEHCECCNKKISDNKQYKQNKLCLDHNPITNKFRGWLCKECNTGIGLLGDNIEGIKRALAYLEKSDNNN